MARPKKNISAHEQSFEVALADLSRIISKMEAGDMPLEEALEAYKEGIDLVSRCQNRLKEVEHTVQLLEDQQLRKMDLDL
jgi:exodeoxyribonuclease VII small subunit